jgi:CreA protein
MEGAPIGEIFSFLSGLYFRGKLAYAERFARPPRGLSSGVFVITPNRGLLGNVLVYMVYSDRIIEGSPKNSTSAVPISPWGGDSVAKCADWVEK